jgi:hypothetical protein
VLINNILSLLISPRNFFLGNKASKQQGRKGECFFGGTNSEPQESKQGECFGDTNSELHEKAKEERSWQMHASPSQMSGQRLLYLDYHNYE